MVLNKVDMIQQGVSDSLGGIIESLNPLAKVGRCECVRACVRVCVRMCMCEQWQGQ